MGSVEHWAQGQVYTQEGAARMRTGRCTHAHRTLHTCTQDAGSCSPSEAWGASALEGQQQAWAAWCTRGYLCWGLPSALRPRALAALGACCLLCGPPRSHRRPAQGEARPRVRVRVSPPCTERGSGHGGPGGAMGHLGLEVGHRASQGHLRFWTGASSLHAIGPCACYRLCMP